MGFFPILILAFILLAVFLYWRFFFFYRDPERVSPEGNVLLSAADGTVVYIKKISNGEVPVSIKKGRKIHLQEILKSEVPSIKEWYLIGVFMHPTSVHVNRSPINGEIVDILYSQGKNLPMTLMWWRVLLGLRPYELNSSHILSNERNVIRIDGDFPVYVIQIADIYVNKIVCFVKRGERVNKGQRIGMIKMGSQVDLLIPVRDDIVFKVKEGLKVKAGESILATYKK